jgi:ubiquinone/menaquinone biosynthesis C-methylase UbiE
MKFSWDPILYDSKHDFVFKYGEEIVNLLNPLKDETILDIGCGTGDLTKKISDLCKKIIGLDNSAEMIKTAKGKFPEIAFIVGDANDFKYDESFDAVFSNAVLHWIPDAEKVIQNINKHLKTGGRFVAEFGGKGCVNKIITTLTDILNSEKIYYPKIQDNLYYPSIGEYSEILEKNGFELNYALLFDRPTELKDGFQGLKNFIEMFLNWLFINVSESDKMGIIEKASNKLKPLIFNGKSWIADYRRIRILAIKN